MPKRNTYQRAERILDAAAGLIARLGYDKTTVSDIAAEAGVAKGAVYLHWASKEELFDALVVHEMQKLMNDLLSRVECDPQGGSLTHMYRHALLSMQANPLMKALYTQDSRVLGAYIHRQDPSRYVERFWFGKAFIEYIQSAGLVRKELDANSLAYVLTIIAYGFTSIETIIPADQAPPLADVADALDDLLSHGIALEGGDDQAGKQAIRMAVDEVNRQYAGLTAVRHAGEK
jgi:AcrR family transcriptional regulator